MGRLSLTAADMAARMAGTLWRAGVASVASVVEAAPLLEAVAAAVEARVAAVESDLSDAVRTSGSYANPSWLVSLAASKLTGLVSAAQGGLGLDSSATPAGSLLRTTGAGVWGTLPVGTNGKVLTVVTGAPAWATPERRRWRFWKRVHAPGVVSERACTAGAVSPPARAVLRTQAPAWRRGAGSCRDARSRAVSRVAGTCLVARATRTTRLHRHVRGCGVRQRAHPSTDSRGRVCRAARRPRWSARARIRF